MQIEIHAQTGVVKWTCPACEKKAKRDLGDFQAALEWIRQTRGYRPCDKCAPQPELQPKLQRQLDMFE